MTDRPMPEGERARALQIAKDIHEADAYALTQWLEECSITEVELVARALLSTSSAVRGMREALGELLAADDAMAAFIIAVEPAVLGETEWAQQHRERSARRRKAIAKARAALSLEGEDKQATRGDDAATAPTDLLKSKESTS